jgi:four helix bundle protein
MSRRKISIHSHGTSQTIHRVAGVSQTGTRGIQGYRIVSKTRTLWPTSQSRRAAFSGAANIVEGASRCGRNEFRHFLDIALGSLCELEYALEVAAALQYLKPETAAMLLAQQSRARFFTWKLKQSMR